MAEWLNSVCLILQCQSQDWMSSSINTNMQESPASKELAPKSEWWNDNACKNLAMIVLLKDKHRESN